MPRGLAQCCLSLSESDSSPFFSLLNLIQRHDRVDRAPLGKRIQMETLNEQGSDGEEAVVREEGDCRDLRGTVGTV